jgi:regulatory protein
MSLKKAGRGSPPPELQGGIITSLTPKGSGGERLSVHVDGRFAFNLSARVAARACLRNDLYLSEAELSALLQEDEPDRARDAALGMLGRREMCAAEVVGRLVGAGISERTAAETIMWLQEWGYVDDRRFAAAYAVAKLKAGWGRPRIAAELVRKGVARELVAGDAWDDLVGQQDGVEGMQQALDLVRRRFAGQLRSDPQGARRRINGFLARRGHDWETISAVFRALKEDGVRGDGEEWPEP